MDDSRRTKPPQVRVWTLRGAIGGVSWLLCAGCFTADFDPSLGGAFACEVGPNSGCLAGATCINQRCETATPPRVEIRSPEPEQAFRFADASGPIREMSITVAGTLTLVDPAEDDEHRFGEGHLQLFVDNHAAMTLTSGLLSGGLTIPTEFANTPGPHRIAAVAVRNDGVPYDHAEAVASRLFWLDDNNPRVAISEPWPGVTFSVEAQSIDVRVAAINFTLTPPGGTNAPGRGHAHLYYDVRPDECILDPACDQNYIAVSQANGALVSATIPESPAKDATLSVVLRNVDHTLYTFGSEHDQIADDTVLVVRE